MVNKKIMLIKPPMHADAVFDPIRTTQPLGLWYIGSYLKEKGYDVTILDTVMEGIENKIMLNSTVKYEDFQRQKTKDLENLTAEDFVSIYSPHFANGTVNRQVVRVGLSDEEIIKRIRDEKPDYIGLSFFATCNHNPSIELAKLIKLYFPNIKIIAGGSHATDMSETVLRDSEGSIDFCVKGDGQYVLEDIVNGKIPQNGVAFLYNRELVDMGESRRMRMDEFSRLNPSLLEHIVLPMPATHTQNTQGRKYVDVMFSRGCKKRCEYCVAGSKKYGFDPLILNKVDNQLKILKEASYEELVLQDDDLLRDKQHFFRVLNLIKKHGFKWQDNGGVAIEDLDKEVVDKILENGMCHSLYVPFNPRSYKINQAASFATSHYQGNVEQLKKLRDSGIYVYTSGIFGTDVQTQKDVDSEISTYKDLIKNGYIDQALVFAVSHLPATRNGELFRQDIVNPNDYLGYSIFVPHAKTKTMGIRDVEVAVVKANKEYNSVQKQTGAWGKWIP